MARNASTEGRLWRLLIVRRRLLLAAAAGVLLFLLLPPSMRLVTRVLMSWDLMAAIYVVSAFVMIARSTVETCHRRAAWYDESEWVITMVVVCSAAASLGTIFTELAVIKSAYSTPWASLLVTAATVVLSWTFTHLVFALHYANIYYRPEPRDAGGLEFPGNRPPDYRDFVYYSFVVGCAAQTGDVNTTSAAMRRATLIQGIVAFVFNTAILALTINVGASLLS
ncbi:MAG: DUF1345 domain-containing protein [Proteobacteria bacterium]|nr:DUF1345 domain-containing protein [Pseudomonadota bacterium]